MIKPALTTALILIALCAGSETQTPTNAPTNSSGISVQEMLVSGPTPLKMHSLAMISQGNVKDPVDESYLPGLKACSEDPSAPLRSISARILGLHFVQDKEIPNPDALAMLQNLAGDPSSDVRFNAIYHGLTQVRHKSPELVEKLIDLAATERNPALQDRIIVALANYQPQVESILNEKLKSDSAIAYYEIYGEFTGKEPPNADKFLDMPSSRTRMFIFSVTGDNPDSAQAELIKELKAVGIQNPSVQISGAGNNHALVVKTYITKEGLAVEKNFSGAGKFKITQQMWLTPELEVQLDAMREASKNRN